MKLRKGRKAGSGREHDPSPAQGAGAVAEGRPAGAPRWKEAQREIAGLRRRVTTLESEVQELRQLSKRLAEITDVVAEVLLPAEQRDEERLREILARYDAQL